MQSFFKVKKPDEIFQTLSDIKPIGTELAAITEALDRILSKDIVSTEDLPGFYRATMDGYAVSSKDTFGASDSLPALLNIAGEVHMGKVPKFSLSRGLCARISTGGMLPEGSDAVVMLEYTRTMEDGMVEISRSVPPLENVILPDDDLKKGHTILHRGTPLRPQELGLLAAVGIKEVEVSKRPRVAIISTGEEVVDIKTRPNKGQVRDINTYTLGGLCVKSGAIPVYLGICRDRLEDLKNMLARGISMADAVLLSGGSSVGVKDFTLNALMSLEGVKLLAHGVSLSPGKPTIIARKGDQTIWGLPGHPVSTMIVFDVFVSYLLGLLQGLTDPRQYKRRTIEAVLDRNIESASGREDYIRARISGSPNKWVATPVLGKSGLISTMAEADGLVKIDMNSEGLYKGEIVTVRFLC